MELHIDDLEDHLVTVALVGRPDTPSVGHVETRLVAHLVPGGNDAVIDPSGVAFVASMGIRMLIAGAKSLRSRRAGLTLFGAQPRVLQVFDTVALPQIVPACATGGEALAAVAQAA